jgi:hypothetical protein
MRFHAIVGMLCVIISSQSFALVSVQALLGKRSQEFQGSGTSKKDLQNTELSLGAHLDPIPLVPVAFGLSLGLKKFDVKKSDHGLDTMTGSHITPEVLAWFPNPTDFKPYGRVGYQIGQVKGSGTGIDYEGKTKGVVFGLGVRWEFMPLVAALLELQLANVELTPESVKAFGADVTSTSKDESLNSKGLFLGVQVSL